jgi:hypothetical protein
MQRVSRQWIGKDVPAATNRKIAIELLWEILLSARSVQSGCKEENWGDQASCHLGSAREAVKIEVECVKLKNLHC